MSGERHLLEPQEAFSFSHCCSCSTELGNPAQKGRAVTLPTGNTTGSPSAGSAEQRHCLHAQVGRGEVAGAPQSMSVPRTAPVAPAEEVLCHQQLSPAPNLSSWAELFCSQCWQPNADSRGSRDITDQFSANKSCAAIITRKNVSLFVI